MFMLVEVRVLFVVVIGGIVDDECVVLIVFVLFCFDGMVYLLVVVVVVGCEVLEFGVVVLQLFLGEIVVVYVVECVFIIVVILVDLLFIVCESLFVFFIGGGVSVGEKWQFVEVGIFVEVVDFFVVIVFQVGFVVVMDWWLCIMQVVEEWFWMFVIECWMVLVMVFWDGLLCGVCLDDGGWIFLWFWVCVYLWDLLWVLCVVVFEELV